MMHPLFLPGEPTPPQAVPLTNLPLLVVVGLTGVGKSHLLRLLAYPTLPDRREVVDRYVLPLFGLQPPLDRVQRFEMTRRFRAEHPGGVAEALLVGQTLPAWPLVFDGLRGRDEVGFALERLPEARFVVLEASDQIRLARLLERGDSFDRVNSPTGDRAHWSDLAQGIFTDSQLEEILSWPVAPSELQAKLTIVAEERKNYDPQGARQVLQGSPRALFLDTERLSPQQEVAQIADWLAQQGLIG
jgi:hypothetical protein